MEFNGSFGVLDVHNAYDLTTILHDPIARTLILAFEANRYILPNKPKSFELSITDITSFEYNVTPETPYDFHVEDITFREPSDRDYEVVFDDIFYDKPGEGKEMVLTLGGSSFMRLL